MLAAGERPVLFEAFLAIGCMAVIVGSGCDGEWGSRTNRLLVDSSSGRDRPPGAGFRSRCRPHDYLNPYVDWLTCDVVGRRLGRTLSAVFSLDDVASIRDGTAGVEVRESCADEPRCLSAVSTRLDHLRSLRYLRFSPRRNRDAFGLLARLPWLRELDLEASSICDEDLHVLSALKNLRVLDLANTGITGAGLADAKLPLLEELHLECSELRDDGVAAVGRFSNLRRLFMPQVAISWRALEQLRRLRNLKVLAIPGLQLLNVGVKPLLELHALERVDLGGTQLSDAGCEMLRALVNLKAINLSGNFVDVDCVRALKSLPRLELLSAQNTGFRELDDDEFPQKRVVNPWPRLRVLGVVHSAIGDEDLRRLARIRSLEELYLDDNPITDAGIQQLGVLHRLRKLSVSRTRVTAKGIARLRRLLPKLEVERSPGATCLPDIGCLRLMRK